MNIILIRQLRFSAEHDPGSPDRISNPLHPQVPALCPCHFPLLERIQVVSIFVKLGVRSQFLGTLVKFTLTTFSRHLSWDLGYGFKIADLYKSGWIVCAITMITAVIVAAL